MSQPDTQITANMEAKSGRSSALDSQLRSERVGNVCSTKLSMKSSESLLTDFPMHAVQPFLSIFLASPGLSALNHSAPCNTAILSHP